MACILHIETSTNVCSVALSKDGYLLYEKEDHGDGMSSKAAEKLGGFISEALARLSSPAAQTPEADKELTTHLDAVSVSSGPGSYTGLRIGVSMAKGVCYGRDAKLISVPTLELLCVPVLLSDRIRCQAYSDGEWSNQTAELADDALLCPMIDARRMEVFAAVYDKALQAVRAPQADIVDAETYREFLENRVVYFFGNGAKKCMEVINHPNARYIDGIEPLAKYMLPLADKRYNKGQTEDVAYFVPQYMKEYQAKKQKDLLHLSGN